MTTIKDPDPVAAPEVPRWDTRLVAKDHQRRTVLLVDGQHDFANRFGALRVPGGDAALERVADMIRRGAGAIDGVVVTLDHHPRYHIGHARWFVDGDGHSAPSFSVIQYEDYVAGRWVCYSSIFQTETASYLRRLTEAGKTHQVWPDHCIIGEVGAALYGPVSHAICEWESRNRQSVKKFLKGLNPLCEQYSAVVGEVPHPDDPDTQVNRFLLALLGMSEEIGVCGLTRNRCVGGTVCDILTHEPALANRLVLLEDGTCDVKGEEDKGDELVAEFVRKGVRVARTTDWV